MIQLISSLTVPIILGIVSLVILFSRGDRFSSFTLGAENGMKSAVSLLPAMVALIASLKMLYASGALDFLTSLLAPLAAVLGIPEEIFPLLVTRPVSGSASNAAFASLISECGADSFPVFAAAIILASSDTILYVSAVYFSGTKIKKTGAAIPAAFTVMLFCIFFACFLARLFFPLGA